MEKNNINWDLIVIGGGVTGAGILREAERNGIKTLLLEQKDFAWGTSSRSSKMVHGGIRYMKEGMFGLTYESVKERQKLLKEAPFLIKTLGFLMPIYKDKSPSKLSMSIGLAIYDLMGLKWGHKFIKKEKMNKVFENLNSEKLKGVFYFEDAKTDDARLVIRLIMEAVQGDSKALNYHRVNSVKKTENGFSVTAFDEGNKSEIVFKGKNVINATGVWSDKISRLPFNNKHIRPLRGSHIVFPRKFIPIDDAIGFSHPHDGRMLFIVPWQNTIICGTTDVDHSNDLNNEPSITKEEFDYLLECVNHYFPTVKLTDNDIISTYAGVRPVVSSGNLSPSQESREFILWKEDGITSVTGGKLTTFRKIAMDTLKKAGFKLKLKNQPVFNKLENTKNIYNIENSIWEKLLGRYGNDAHKVVKDKAPPLLDSIPGTDYLWAELPYTVEKEKIHHLSDLLLRRVRVGNILQEGGLVHLDMIESLCSEYLPWDSDRWRNEKDQYIKFWRKYYSIP
ncbi:MAG: glycerol-3-phosphate dehydrogenase/oxidase [Deltaproteobacteria bacterium]|nr:glycerol-3-phosphate dehydrogenase/oxidase [Deltaproteobacteria bacterium]